MTIFQYEHADAVADAVVTAVVNAATDAITQRGVFHLALAGGTTPKACYQRLRSTNIPWKHVHIWFGDERCLASGDLERNDVMADQTLLNHVPIPSHQIHRIQAEQGAEQAAKQYETCLATIPCLDVVLLGMGEDGHTASLFPHHPALQDERLVIPVFHAPKAPSSRVSLGYHALRAARQRIIIVTGEGKRDAYERVCRGEKLPVRLKHSLWFSSLTVNDHNH